MAQEKEKFVCLKLQLSVELNKTLKPFRPLVHLKVGMIFWYRSFYPHPSRYSVSLICGLGKVWKTIWGFLFLAISINRLFSKDKEKTFVFVNQPTLYSGGVSCTDHLLSSCSAPPGIFVSQSMGPQKYTNFCRRLAECTIAIPDSCP